MSELSVQESFFNYSSLVSLPLDRLSASSHDADAKAFDLLIHAR